MDITIGRESGPVTDLEASSEFAEGEYQLVTDVIAMVNAATRNAERWYVTTEKHGKVIPVTDPNKTKEV